MNILRAKTGLAGTAAFAALLCCLWTPCASAARDAVQLLATTGALPASGRIVIRSGLGWLLEDDPLFASVARALSDGLQERGLTVVSVESSRPAPQPPGIAAVRHAPVPENKGAPHRIMSVAEAVSRMSAMQLAREGRLPQSSFKGGAAGVARRETSALPALTQPEMIRFALSQENGLPELRGMVTIPGRLPEEIHGSDPETADYALIVRFAMLWPASGVPDTSGSPVPGAGLAMGWYLVQMECYALEPARNGKAPERTWSATVQRVAFSAYIGARAPGMARDAVAEG